MGEQRRGNFKLLNQFSWCAIRQCKFVDNVEAETITQGSEHLCAVIL
jgi:hypothetical protein